MGSIRPEKKRCHLAQLRNAISNFSNSRITKRILTAGVDVNEKFLHKSSNDCSQSDFNTALHIAATQTNVTNLTTLLNHGADVAIKDSDGFTPLCRVVRDCLSDDADERPDNSFISSMLLTHITSKNVLNPCDNDGFTHFHVACVINNIDAIKFFLNNGVSVNHAVRLDSSFFPGYTPLHFATRFSSLETAEILVKQGANASLKDARGTTPLHVLIERKIAMLELIEVKEKLEDNDSVRAVLEQINNNEKILQLLLYSENNYADDIGMSKYHAICTLQKSIEAARLLDHIENVNAHVNLDSPIWPGYTMLHFAAHCNVHTMQLLLEKGANIQAKDASGVTPFDIFIKWCKIRDLYSIISMINLWNNITFSDGRTKLLDCIAAMNTLNQFKTFLQSNIDDVNVFLPIESVLWPGSTLLHLAVMFAERFTAKNLPGKKPKAFQPLTSAEINSHIVKACLDFGTSINSRDVHGRTPLHLAFRLGKSRVVDMLLRSYRETANPVDNENLSPLHIACAVRNKWVIEEWLTGDIDVDVVYTGNKSNMPHMEPGWTPLHVAVSSNAHSSVAEMLLKHGADPYRIDKNNLTPIHLLLISPQIDPNLSKLLLSLPDLRESVANNVAFTHLHVASYFNNVKAVERLLDLGTNIDTPSSLPRFQNCTPLHVAIMNQSMEVVNVLVRRGADVLAMRPNGLTPLSKVLTSNKHGRSLKMFVTILRSNEMLRRRVETELGLTMLHIVCRAGHVDAIKDLLNKGAKPNAKIRNDSLFWPGWTPLHVLVAMGTEIIHQKKQQNDFKAMLKMLLDHGSLVTIANADGDTPLHLILKKYPCDIGYFIMTSLLAYQKDFGINPVNKDGLTHFHTACLANNLEAAEKFLEHGGIDVNQPVDYFAHHYAGSTPLHLALNSNSKRYFGIDTQLRMIDLLLKYKPDLQAEDDHAYTPLHVAADCDPSCIPLFEKLIDNGADIDAETIDGKTVFEMILLSKEISIEEINFFIKRNYHINGCNLVTDKGYLSVILNEKSTELRSEILKTLMSAPNIVAADRMGRTAIHNIVATNDLVISMHNYVNLINKLTKLGCDINEQDKSGMTALHLALLFRNKEATTALLICGVDINIIDSYGKTAFSYALDPCTRCLTRCNTTHDYLLKVLVEHVHKLKLFRLYVSELNEKMKVLALENRWIRNLDILANVSFVTEHDKGINNIIIGPRGWTLHDFLKERGAVNDYYTLTQAERTVIDQFFETIDYHSFRDIKYMLKLQYRQAVARGALIKPAIASIKLLLGLPDLCAEAIVWYLRNPDLKNVTKAADNVD